MKWTFIVLCVFLCSLLFRQQPLPPSLFNAACERYLPSNLVVRVEGVSVGFRQGLCLRGLRVSERDEYGAVRGEPTASAGMVSICPVSRELEIDELKYPRLPDGYYAPGNHERNAKIAAKLPTIPTFELTLTRPDILAVTPERVIADIRVECNRFVADRIRLDWADKDEEMYLDGFCHVDLEHQRIDGEVRGSAKQHHIRPLLVALDVPVSLPYMDAFTEVKGKVPSYCGWHVNLVNNDFDLDLDLHPVLGKYNLVPMRRADGKLHLHVYTRGDSLNYHHTIGPIAATSQLGKPLDGTVVIDGLNGTNTVRVTAKSAMPIAEILRIGGFTGDYVGNDVFGSSICDLEFRFPRSMGSDYSKLNGRGHVTVKDGRLMRMKGFKGLLDDLAERVPGVSWFTDSTQASGDYVIRNGVISSDNMFIEGSVFSIKMYGQFDAVKNELDYTVRVQFTKNESLIGKIVHPLTWPFTKLLLEFKLTGTPEKPKWKYLTVVDRVMEAVK